MGLYRLDFRPEKPGLRFGGGSKGGDGHTKTGENCPKWNHRSSAPPGPLPKKEGNVLQVVVHRIVRKKILNV